MLKKILMYICLSILLTCSSAGAETLNIQNILDYAEQNNPSLIVLKNKLIALEEKQKEVDSYYDHFYKFNAERYLNKDNPSFAAEPEKADVFKSKVSLMKNFEFGLKAEFFTSYEESNYDYNDYLIGSLGVPSLNVTDANGLLPHGSVKVSYGVNMMYPLLQNGGGILEKIQQELLSNDLKMARIYLTQQRRDLKLKIYQSYYALELTQALIAGRKDSVKRNQEYLNITNQKRNDGAIPEVERQQVELTALNTEEELLAANQLYYESLMNLKNAIGYNQEQALNIDFSQSDNLPTLNNIQDFINKIAENDLGEQGLSLNVLSSIRRIEGAQNLMNQQLNLKFALHYNGQDFTAQNAINRTLSFSYPTAYIGIESDLFGETNKSKALLGQAKAAELIAENDLDSYRKTINNAALSCYDNYMNFEKMLKISQLKMDKYIPFLAGVKDQFSKGRIDVFQLTQAENTYTLVQLGHLQNKVKFKIAQATAAYLMGRL